MLDCSVSLSLLGSHQYVLRILRYILLGLEDCFPNLFKKVWIGNCCFLYKWCILSWLGINEAFQRLIKRAKGWVVLVPWYLRKSLGQVCICFPMTIQHSSSVYSNIRAYVSHTRRILLYVGLSRCACHSLSFRHIPGTVLNALHTFFQFLAPLCE